ncbi:hypothetical protein MSAN_01739300 [Mycena sanguinolenta]|uniref:Uncharacterized protein n=1 Tax=Mycena sanguinolenta TaxID=230812 RepID=A0A8H6Y0C9_9AGAR|nr:hypothetical protein MSAN_01739300 [Mycena sanguinolenta]
MVRLSSLPPHPLICFQLPSPPAWPLIPFPVNNQLDFTMHANPLLAPPLLALEPPLIGHLASLAGMGSTVSGAGAKYVISSLYGWLFIDYRMYNVFHVCVPVGGRALGVERLHHSTSSMFTWVSQASPSAYLAYSIIPSPGLEVSDMYLTVSIGLESFLHMHVDDLQALPAAPQLPTLLGILNLSIDFCGTESSKREVDGMWSGG